MSKKILFIFLIVVAISFLSGCIQGNSTNISNSNLSIDNSQPKADKVQVYLFHSTQRCVTCIAIGRLSEETVAEYFQSDLRDGKIEFKEINVDLPENKELAKKFQASGSSLFINAIKDNQDNISEDVNVWRLTSNEPQFKNYLKNKLNNLLGK